MDRSLALGLSRIRRAFYYTSVAAVAFVATSGVADAQTSKPSRDAAVDEVVVTAQRREQTLLDVPISVDVVDAQQIQRSAWAGAKEYTQMVPNVFFNENDSQSSKNGDISIRGISDLTSGANERSIQSRPAIGTYVDDFSVGSVAGGSANPPLNDVERVEILRGPQSVYFGRAAEGGAINIVSKKPVDEDSLRLQVGYGNFNTQNYGAVVNHALADNLFFRAGATWDQSDGYVENLSPTGTDAFTKGFNGRAALRWAPTNWTIDGVVQVTEERDGNLGKIPTGVSPSGFVGAGTGGNFSDLASCGMGRALIMTEGGGGNTKYNCENTPAHTNIGNVLTTLRVEYAGEKVTFTSLSGRIVSSYDQLEDVDNTGGDVFSRTNNYHTKSMSQEFRLSSKDDQFKLGSMPLDWTLGLYGYDDRSHTENTIITGKDAQPGLLFLTVPGDHPNENNQEVTRTGYAAFVDATLHLTDTLSLSVGARYSHDKDTQAWTDTYASFDCPTRVVVGGVVPALAPGCSVRPDMLPLTIFTDAGGRQIVTGGRYAQNLFTNGQTSGNDFSPRIALNWRPSETQSFYATYAQGYNPVGVRVAPDSMGLAQATGAIPTPDTRSFYAEEVVTNYELGWRGYFADHKVLVQADVFRMDWDNLQFRLDRTLCRLPNGTYVVQGSPESVNCDPAGGFIPDNHVLNAKLARSQGVEATIDARVNEYFQFGAAVGYLDAKYVDFTNAPTDLGPPGHPGDLSGQRMPNAPKWSGAVHATVSWTTGDADWYTTVTAAYKGQTYTTFGSVGQTGWPRAGTATTLVNMVAGVDWRGNEFNLSVENLFDKSYVLGTEGLSGMGIATNIHPRLIRMTWSHKFGG